jgi:signal transduction histidine kinase
VTGDCIPTHGIHRRDLMDPQPTPPNIIVVDDVPANLHLLAGILGDCGYRVRSSPSGALALQSAALETPDLILLDVSMPGMDGYEVCRRLKADPALAPIPVIFISAHSETFDKLQAFALGGVDYVTKPFQVEEIKARVATHLQLRRMQVELEAQARKLRESNERLLGLEGMRDELTHMIVHDLRSPLAGLMGYLSMLDARKQQDDPNVRRYVEGGLQCATILRDLISAILDLNRLEAGQFPLRMATADLSAVCGEAIAYLGAATVGRKFGFIKPPQPVLVAMDADLMRRVVANLLGNALKFTPADGAVTLAVEVEGSGARVSVTDQGRGIPPELQRAVFDKFVQAHHRTETHDSSVGLGLAFCKQAVEAQGASIGLRSEVGRGSTFWVTFPRG